MDIDECPKCRGVWFDQGELRQAKDAADPDLNWMDFEIFKHEGQFKSSQAGLKCPTCTKPLVRLQYGQTQVEIDCCPSCRGIWLDQGEFKRIVESLQEELLAKPFSQYVKDSIQEAKEMLTGPERFLSEWRDLATVLGLAQLRLFVENPKLLQKVMTIQRLPLPR